MSRNGTPLRISSRRCFASGSKAACFLPAQGAVVDLWKWVRLENSRFSSPAMVLEPVEWPNCESTKVVKHGQLAEDKQRPGYMTQ